MTRATLRAERSSTYELPADRGAGGAAERKAFSPVEERAAQPHASRDHGRVTVS
ncbi:hypothetical protein [Agrococcus sp. Ld7]|uniref:hypothetical protein n=1 Tax=Agrococcus sp. Ld7 TaxID=649148 RepID=UPI00386D3F92